MVTCQSSPTLFPLATGPNSTRGSPLCSQQHTAASGMFEGARTCCPWPTCSPETQEPDLPWCPGVCAAQESEPNHDSSTGTTDCPSLPLEQGPACSAAAAWSEGSQASSVHLHEPCGGLDPGPHFNLHLFTFYIFLKLFLMTWRHVRKKKENYF